MDGLNPPTREVGDVYQLIHRDAAPELRAPFRLLSRLTDSIGYPRWTVETLHNQDRGPVFDWVLDAASSQLKPFFLTDESGLVKNPARVAQQIWTAASVEDSAPFTLLKFDTTTSLWSFEVKASKATGLISDLVLHHLSYGSVMHFDEDWTLYRYPSRMSRPEVDRKHFPHSCPRCRAPAYVGMKDVECSRTGCRP